LKAIASKVAGAATSVGKGAVDAMAEAIVGVSDVINNGMDTDPTIRPVIDLSNIETGAKSISALFSRKQAVAISADRVAKANAAIQLEETNQNGNNGKTVTYTQNNYSPKALSRLEIYRQTNRQLKPLKDG